MAKWKRIVEAQMRPLSLSGIVLDQDNQPVSGAEVKVQAPARPAQRDPADGPIRRGEAGPSLPEGSGLPRRLRAGPAGLARAAAAQRGGGAAGGGRAGPTGAWLKWRRRPDQPGPVLDQAGLRLRWQQPGNPG